MDRLIHDTIEARVAVARLIREHCPRIVFTTAGAGVHPSQSYNGNRYPWCVLRLSAEVET